MIPLEPGLVNAGGVRLGGPLASVQNQSISDSNFESEESHDLTR